jgi:uncharacterized protein
LEKCRLFPDTSKHRMSEAVLEKMIQGYMATIQPVYTFGWQGGEPTLMGLNFFREVIDLQKKYGRAGTPVANGIQTNATLIDDRFAEHLARYRFLVGCSLDGPAQIHDRYRRTRAGGPSHAAVLKGINILKRHRVEFNVLVLVTQANVHRARDVYSYLVDQGFYYLQYIPCVEFDEKGTLMPYAITGQQWGDFMCTIFDQWYLRNRNTVSVRNFDSILQKLIDGSSNICTLGDNCCQYFVVEHNGDIYPCDFFVQENLKIGNIMDMSWKDALRASIYNDFGTQKSCYNSSCTTCDCLDLCMGDCLKHRVYGDHAAQNQSWLCTGWQQLIRHTRDKLQVIAKELRERQISANQRELRSKADRRIRSARPGRNQPCPCGSNLKFKKCCGQ